ncbi:hypothetical protein DFP73DRAFT_601580 [Morchella snyderi]|nr:hypothetical protein DFP73DRAFT_601580 [Morchella snyderi]
MYDIYGKNITDLSLFELNTRANEELYKEFYRRNTASFYWGPEPNYRGSWTILKSTIFTIVLVLWRLVNVDVYPTATTRQRATYKAIWLVSAIISPATVSLYARRQLLEARGIQKYSSENAPGGRALELGDGTSSGHQHLSTAQFTNGYAPIPKLGNSPHELKMNAAFLLISGGFEYDKGGEGGGSIISPLEFKRLLDERQFGERSEGLAHISEAITEKEKVETFAKVIIALQLCSTMVEGVVRDCTPLPSTLLEMHISTVLCACVLICVYWWNKPFGITTPVKLKVLGWDRCKQIWGEGNERKPRDDDDCILGIFRTQMKVLRNPQDIHYVVNVGSWALLCFISWGWSSVTTAAGFVSNSAERQEQ